MNFSILLVALAAVHADDPKGPSFEDDVKPILREHCLKCHGDDTHKADLNLQSYPTLVKGGSGGAVVVAGRSGASMLYQAIAREGDATPMPPNRPRIADGQVETVKRWIDQGLRESASSQASLKRPSLEFKASVEETVTGPPPMPENLPTIDTISVRRPHPVTALATSPRAPLLAVAGQERIVFVHLETRERIGSLAFPEGVPFVLRFSRDGRILVAAGGRPARSGRVVLFEVRSGRRLAEIGDELDSVLAADLSPDQKWLALGGTGKLVKVFATTNGRLAYGIAKHTDWITCLGFSPDGSKLASGDRSGAVHLWDSSNGGIVLSLSEHKDSVNSLDWRSDSALLATGGEDGKVILWDTQAGWPSASIDAAHPLKASLKSSGKRSGGVLSTRFLADGRLVTSGRDQTVRIWDGSGRPIASYETPKVVPIQVVGSRDGQLIVAGDSSGDLHFWKCPEPRKP